MTDTFGFKSVILRYIPECIFLHLWANVYGVIYMAFASKNDCVI